MKQDVQTGKFMNQLEPHVVGGGIHGSLFEQIISPENIFAAWREFQQGKMRKRDVLEFSLRAEEHLLALATDLAGMSPVNVPSEDCHPERSRGIPEGMEEIPRLEDSLGMTENRKAVRNDKAGIGYHHGQYTRFTVCDPKRREIAKASVRDRVLHHAIHRVLAPLFDRSFIFDSYSSRVGKGTHAAGKRFRKFAWRLSRNHTKTVWVLQLDVRRFFDSVDHGILLGLLWKKISKVQQPHPSCHSERVCESKNLFLANGDPSTTLGMTGKNDLFKMNDDENNLLHLLGTVIRSFETTPGKGIPLGNLTSQLFSNVSLDPLDQFAKRTLRAKHYLRYADDVAILSRDRAFLERCRDEVSGFLKRELGLELHPKKVTLKKWHEGIDFLGSVHFPFHAVLRTRTKRRALTRLSPKNAASYLGVTRHVRARGIERNMRSILDFRLLSGTMEEENEII